MLIDLTKKPLIVYPEECVSSVVVRTIGNQDVTGLLHRMGARTAKDLPPAARVTRGRSTLYETRVPLPSNRRVEEDLSEPPLSRTEWRRIGPMRTRVLGDGIKPPQFRPVIIPVDPYEVASVYQDMLTDLHGTWRASIRVEYLKKVKKAPWVVTILDATSGAHLSSVAVSGLDPNPLMVEPLPLTKALQRTTGPANAWTKLLDDEDD